MAASSTELVREGRVWTFGDQINTDLILPGATFRMPASEQHRLCFSAIRPGWVDETRVGDLIVAGEGFGMGSSRPIGDTLLACGIRGIVAETVNGLALRNLTNVCLPTMECPGVSGLFAEGDVARVDFATGLVENVTRGRSLQGRRLPDVLLSVIAAGGIIPMLAGQGLIEPRPFIAQTT